MFNKRLDPTFQADHLFWFGDMNYRIDLDYKPGVKPKKLAVDSPEHLANFAKVAEMIENKQWGDLMEHDQLRLEMARGAVFNGFTEGAMAFSPTFKVKRETGLSPQENSVRESSKQFTFHSQQRIQSYCDRVLHHSLPTAAPRLTHKATVSVEDVFTSDHKPVRSEYSFFPQLPVSHKSSQSTNHQLIVSNMRCTGGDMEERDGVYLVFNSYPESELL